ncbi:MAG TPA: hypothetical protein VK465_16090 [Fibrobacteria bacterium]|nr:hypothetical protein [Fibrobacteria bacterium]
MTIALLLITALILVATMLFLTVGVNELEKKSLVLGELTRKRYTLRNQVKKKPAAPAAQVVPGKPQPSPGR